MRLIMLCIVALLVVLPVLAQESDYTVFISDQQGFLNVVSVRLVDGRAYATTEKTINAGNNYSVSVDGNIYAEAHFYQGISVIVMAEVDNSEQDISRFEIESPDFVSLNFTRLNELVVRYSDSEYFEPAHVAWFNQEQVVHHVQLPEYMCEVESISGHNLLVDCNHGYYLLLEDQEPRLLPVNTIAANFCGTNDVDICLSQEVPVNGAMLTRYELVGLELVQMETVAITQRARSPFYLGGRLVQFGIGETEDHLYLFGEEDPFAHAVSSFRASDDGAIFWINYVDYGLHIWNNDITYSAGLDFNPQTIRRVVEN